MLPEYAAEPTDDDTLRILLGTLEDDDDTTDDDDDEALSLPLGTATRHVG